MVIKLQCEAYNNSLEVTLSCTFPLALFSLFVDFLPTPFAYFASPSLISLSFSIYIQPYIKEECKITLYSFLCIINNSSSHNALFKNNKERKRNFLVGDPSRKQINTTKRFIMDSRKFEEDDRSIRLQVLSLCHYQFIFPWKLFIHFHFIL